MKIMKSLLNVVFVVVVLMSKLMYGRGKKIVAVTPLKFFGRYNEVSFLSRLSFIFYQNFDNDSNLFELRCLRWILKDFRHLLRQH